jgi:hypothetical protein
MMIVACIAVVAITLLCALACGICWRIAYADGWEAGRQHERNRRNERRIRANRAQFPAVPPQFRRQDAPWFTTVIPSRLVQGGIGGPSTVPIAHMRTATGSFRAATDEFVGQMQADEEAYRRQLRQEINA